MHTSWNAVTVKSTQVLHSLWKGKVWQTMKRAEENKRDYNHFVTQEHLRHTSSKSATETGSSFTSVCTLLPERLCRSLETTARLIRAARLVCWTMTPSSRSRPLSRTGKQDYKYQLIHMKTQGWYVLNLWTLYKGTTAHHQFSKSIYGPYNMDHTRISDWLVILNYYYA